MRMKVVGRIGICLVCFSVFSTSIFGQEAKVMTKEKYMALSMYNFTKMLNWSDKMRAKEVFSIAVIGSKDVSDELIKCTANRLNGSQKYEIVYFDKAEELKGSHHLVFVANWQCSRFMKLEQSQFTNTLIVTEKEGMIGNGSAINFIPKAGSIQFELSEQNTKNHGLVMNSKLKAMAIMVD